MSQKLNTAIAVIGIGSICDEVVCPRQVSFGMQNLRAD
jgi:hypothetical protein